MSSVEVEVEAQSDYAQNGAYGTALEQCIRHSLSVYFGKLNGTQPAGMYDMVLTEVERPLFEVVLSHTDGNLTHAAQLLGMNRATLRKKLKKHGLHRN